MAKPTSESGTVTRKPDDAVGSRGTPATGGGHHTPEQAAVTDMGAGGGTPRQEPKENWGRAGEPGRSPPAVGGSSGGHSDQKASRGQAADAKVAGGHARAERGDGT